MSVALELDNERMHTYDTRVRELQFLLGLTVSVDILFRVVILDAPLHR